MGNMANKGKRRRSKKANPEMENNQEQLTTAEETMENESVEEASVKEEETDVTEVVSSDAVSSDAIDSISEETISEESVSEKTLSEEADSVWAAVADEDAESSEEVAEAAESLDVEGVEESITPDSFISAFLSDEDIEKLQAVMEDNEDNSEYSDAEEAEITATDDIALEDKTFEENASEEITSEDSVSEDSVSEDSVSEERTTEEGVSEDNASEELVAAEISEGESAPAEDGEAKDASKKPKKAGKKIDIVGKIKSLELGKKLKGNSEKGGISIGVKMAVGFVVPILGLLILGIISYKTSSKSLISSYEVSTTQSIESLASYLDYCFYTVGTAGAEIISNVDTKEYVQELKYSQGDADFKAAATNIDNYITLKVNYNRLIANVIIIPKNFTVRTTYKTTTEQAGFYEDIFYSPDYSFSTTSGVWTSSHAAIDERLNIKPESYAVSLYRQVGTSTGILVIDIAPDELAKIFEDLNFGEGSMLGLVLPDGKELYYSELVPEAEDFLTSQEFYIENVTKETPNGSTYVKIKGKKHLFVYSTLTNGSVVFALVPEANITSQADGLKLLTAIMLVISVAIASVIALYLSKSISRPIKSILGNLSKVAEGDFTVEFKKESNDEFGKLTDSIRDTVSEICALIVRASEVSELVQDSANDVIDHSKTMADLATKVSESMEGISHTVEVETMGAQSCVTDMDVLSQKIDEANTNVSTIKDFAYSTKELIAADIEEMNALTGMTKETSAIMQKLIESFKQLRTNTQAVNGFVEIIDGIASQTNLLSLNASIEAARAGEAGRGFSVVAEEIRKLADQSSDAANEIKNTADDIVNQLAVVVTHAESADDIVEKQNITAAQLIDTFKGLDNQVETLLQKVEEIDNSMNEMNAARVTTLDSIGNISASTEETYSLSSSVDVLMQSHEDASNELTRVSLELKEKSNELDEVIKRFKI